MLTILSFDRGAGRRGVAGARGVAPAAGGPAGLAGGGAQAAEPCTGALPGGKHMISVSFIGVFISYFSSVSLFLCFCISFS